MVIYKMLSQTALFFVIAYPFGHVSSFNFEVNKAGIATGEKGTQFGYSVAIVRRRESDKVLLIGAPNRTVDDTKGHGDVTQCNSPLTQNITWVYKDIKEPSNLCKKYLAKDGQSKCEQDQRMGATLAVNRRYKPNITDSLVTICAPGWRNTYNEFENSKMYYVFGVCLKMLDDLKIVDDCHRKRDNCWPFWPRNKETFKNTQPYYALSQAGVSATYSTDGSNQIIGAPGFDLWRGSYKFVQSDRMTGVHTDYNTLFFGYSIASAKFGDESNFVVAGIPNYHSRSQGHTGKVEILEDITKKDFMELGIQKTCKDITAMDFKSADLKKDQVGTKFGATVFSVDITGDGSDEIFVGAPYYSGKHVDEGRVFVYTVQIHAPGQLDVCGPIGILSGGANYPGVMDKVEFARFGTSISSAGDLNGDEYNDVVIGAPYEDGGKGAVYVYHGLGSCDCIMEDKYSQRISGEAIDPGLRGFGWSLYGAEDIDSNGYPDLLVGAYASDSAVVLRSRPIVLIDGEMETSPNPLPLRPDLLRCSVDGSLCFNLTVRFRLSEPGDRNVKHTMIRLKLDADTLYKSSEGGGSRVVFRQNGKSVLTQNITIETNSTNEHHFTLDVLKYKNGTEPRDAMKRIRIEAKYELIPEHIDDFGKLDPIIDTSSAQSMAADMEFDIKCEDVDKCSSDLVTRVRVSLIGGRAGSEAFVITNETAIYLDFANELLIQTDVINMVNYSYGANFTSTVNADYIWHTSGYGKVGATCETMKKASVTCLNCTVDTIKLNQNDNFKVIAHFDISRQSLITGNRISTMKEHIDVHVKSFQAYKDINPDNNEFYQRIPVRLKCDVEIYEDNTESYEFRYKGDPNSNKAFPLKHIYYVRNDGPSFLPKTYVNISVPVQKGGVKIAEIEDYPTEFCSIAGYESQRQTTTAQSVTDPTTAQSVTDPTTDIVTIPELDPSRRRRAINKQSPSLSQTNEKGSTKKKHINCRDSEYQCEVIECLIEDFETSDRPDILVTLKVYEKTLAREKGVLEVHYETEAKATDPAVWFGDKVVPWNDDVSAQKTTVFVVEQATLVDEIDLWIIFVSIGGALLLLILVIVVLWKCGFFKRKRHQEVQKWKNESLYNKRRSNAPSSLTQSTSQPHSAFESNEKADGI